MDIAITVLALTCIINLFLGLFVLTKNPKSKTGQVFFAISVFISAWAISNHLTDNANHLSQNILFNRLSYLLGFLAIVSAAGFSYVFTGRKLKPRWLMPLTAASVILIAALSVTSYIAGTVSVEAGELVFTVGVLIPLYMLACVVAALLIVKNFYNLLHHGRPLQKTQARIITAAFTASILLGVLTNLVIPSSTSNFETAKFGPPLLSVLLVGSISYAIVKHRLFDIRLLVARSFAYLLTLGFVAIIYVLVIIVAAHSIFVESKTLASQQVFYVIFAIFAALSFQPVKGYFNKFTNKLFLRDYYEPQDVLNRLSDLLVRSIDLNEIQTGSANIIKDAIRPAWFGYLLIAGHKLDELKQNKLLQQLFGKKTDIVLLDEIEPTIDTDLQQLLTEKEIGAAVALRTKTAHLGFMLLGYKKSGEIYSETDKKMISIAADEIAISLQNALHFEEISRFNVTLQKKVDEATVELLQANQRLKELDKTKDEFISMASHQLRTPLTAIKGYLSLVLDGTAGAVTEQEKTVIKRAYDGAQKMTYLIGDMLNVSRIESGKFIIENKPTNLAQLVDGELSQLLETAAGRQIKLNYQKPDSFPQVLMDENKIRQVVMNFLDNAIHYTRQGGTVTAEVKDMGDNVEFTVTDTGVGVPKAVQSQLFAKFYRADNARKMRPDGTGLGLFMAKKVIDAQGGMLIFHSEEGKGSTFGFRLPKKPLAVASVAAPLPNTGK